MQVPTAQVGGGATARFFLIFKAMANDPPVTGRIPENEVTTSYFIYKGYRLGLLLSHCNPEMTTMKLYYAPGACSLSPHIALIESGLPFSIERVDFNTRRTETGEDYAAVNVRGYVPALRLDSGDVLTEGAAIVQFIADKAPASGLAPQAGTLERARLQEALNFIASELHKAFSPLFRPATDEQGKQDARKAVALRLGQVEAMLSDGRAYLLGERFSVADGYLFTVVSWSGHAGIALDPWPKLQAFMGRLAQRPSIRQAIAAEGLPQAA